MRLMRKLMRRKNAWPFLDPVDPVALNIPDYPDVVKHPMDLSQCKVALSLLPIPVLLSARNACDANTRTLSCSRLSCAVGPLKHVHVCCISDASWHTQEKLSAGNYPSLTEWRADVELTFNNAILYNPAGEHAGSPAWCGGRVLYAGTVLMLVAFCLPLLLTLLTLYHHCRIHVT